ncbi:MAG: hypothetical protein D6741_12840 [Planctomycetota bacterium]|nr:MAG: hypothetical protein D6741_12840 [Planctomycetota bacterium]
MSNVVGSEALGSTWAIAWYALAVLVNALPVTRWAWRTWKERIQATGPSPNEVVPRDSRRLTPEVFVAGVACAVFAGLAVSAMLGSVPILPVPVRRGIDAVLNPASLLVASIVLTIVVARWRVIVARRWVGLAVANGAAVFVLLSLPDRHFFHLVSQPDNIAIVLLLGTVGFFVWLGLHLGCENDDRIAAGKPPVEAEPEEQQRFLVWPDLVYIELIAMVLTTAALLIWSGAVAAPLEAPADPLVTPNPAKAPWYFLGLQELLVYFDPWLAGAVYPILIIVGLCAVPYLDRNPLGNGYYTCRERPLALWLFYFGFLNLWVLLIVIGTFFRGPNWGFYGLYEGWETAKTAVHGTRTLSETVWGLFGLHGAGTLDAWPVFLRELPGLVTAVMYVGVLPVWIACGPGKRLVREMGRMRYIVFVGLSLAMFLIPLKMLCRFTLGISYFLSFPEAGIHV